MLVKCHLDFFPHVDIDVDVDVDIDIDLTWTAVASH